MVRLQPADLVEVAIKAIDSFVAVQQVKTLDAHADEKRGYQLAPFFGARAVCSVM